MTEYDGLAPGDESEVSRALQRRLAKVWTERRQESEASVQNGKRELSAGASELSNPQRKRTRKR